MGGLRLLATAQRGSNLRQGSQRQQGTGSQLRKQAANSGSGRIHSMNGTRTSEAVVPPPATQIPKSVAGNVLGMKRGLREENVLNKVDKKREETPEKQELSIKKKGRPRKAGNEVAARVTDDVVPSTKKGRRRGLEGGERSASTHGHRRKLALSHYSHKDKVIVPPQYRIPPGAKHMDAILDDTEFLTQLRAWLGANRKSKRTKKYVTLRYAAVELLIMYRNRLQLYSM